MKQKKNSIKKCLTLVELLVSISLFSAATMMAVEVFINVTRIQARIHLESAIYEDARFMMERIAREIRNSAIDYEEYFTRAILDESQAKIGEKYGCYAAQFYNPGIGKVGDRSPDFIIPGDLGAICTDGTRHGAQSNCTLFRPSVDINTGEFPYRGKNIDDGKEKSNAFCPLVYNKKNHPDFWQSGDCTGDENFYALNKLFLINREGNIKTILARKKVKASPDEYALAMFKIAGEDTDNDEKFDKWTDCANNNTYCCLKGFDCDMPNTFSWAGLNDLLNNVEQSNRYKMFVPISPMRTNVSNLRFDIKPVEDPRKAYSEADKIEQPRVTISLTVKPNEEQISKFISRDAVPEFTLQTTVSPRVMTNIDSFMGAKSNDLCLDFL